MAIRYSAMAFPLMFLTFNRCQRSYERLLMNWKRLISSTGSESYFLRAAFLVGFLMGFGGGGVLSILRTTSSKVWGARLMGLPSLPAGLGCSAFMVRYLTTGHSLRVNSETSPRSNPHFQSILLE